MGRKSGAVMYLLSGRGEYYRIDSDCLPKKKVSPITQFSLEIAFWGWTVADKCIYCIGGIKEEEANTYTVGKTLYKYNTTDSTDICPEEFIWECIEPNRNLRWYKTSVFAFDRKMYVIGGHGYDLRPGSECDKDTDLTLPGEYYNLDSGTWQCMPKMEGIQDFNTIARVMDDKTTILFYNGDTFLFYNLVEDAWKDRLSNVPLGVRDGLENCHCRDILFSVINNARPMVCDSTLYWFNMDMCLYGFDYNRKRWFQSNSLQQKLEWPIRLHRDNLCYPLLLYLNNQTFVALYAIPGSKVLPLAIITVKRDANSGSLKVSLKSSQYIAVETSHSMIDIVDGMTLDASAEEKEVEKGQWRLPTFFRAIGVIGAVAFVAVASGFYKKSH